MPNTQLSDLNYAQNTHNHIISNTSAILAIAMVKKYITKNFLPSTGSSSSSSSSSDVQVHSLSVEGNNSAKAEIATLIQNYLFRSNSLLQLEDRDYLLEQTNPNLVLVNELDKVTLIDNNNIEVQWYLPRREIFAAVIAAITDTDVNAWPMIGGNNLEQEKIARLDEFDQINKALRQDSNHTMHGICSTGVRHAWLQALNGYGGQHLVFGDEGIILNAIRNAVIGLLNKKWEMSLSDDKDPSEEQLKRLPVLWKNIFLPWLSSGMMPDKIIAVLNQSSLAKEIEAAYLRVGIKPDDKLTAQIESFITPKALADFPCDLMPFLTTLNAWISKYQLSMILNKSNRLPSPQSNLATQIFLWLQNNFFSQNPAQDIQTFYRLDRLFQVFDILKQNTILDMADITDMENKDDYFAAFTYLKACHNDASLSLSRFLDDEPMLLDKHLRHFDKGYQILRKNLYKDFIANIFSSWFAGNNMIHAQLFKNIAEVYLADCAAIKAGDKKLIIFLSDKILTEVLGGHQQGLLDIDAYYVNRILLHAIIFPTTMWSSTFYQVLTSTIAFIRSLSNGLQQPPRCHQLRPDAYPNILLDDIDKRIHHYNNPTVAAEFISNRTLLAPLMVSVADIYRMFEYLALSKAPYTLIKRIVEANTLLNQSHLNEQAPFLLAQACTLGHVDLVEYWLRDKNANIDYIDAQRNTVLHTAINGGYLDIVTLLLEHGANRHFFICNQMGFAPLHQAVWKNNTQIVNQLIIKGADISIKNSRGLNVLHIAVQQKNRVMVERLLAAGINPNVGPESSHDTALALAIEQQDIPITTCLLAAGADVNLKTHEGVPPLYLALKSKNVNLVNCLIQAGANVNVSFDWPRVVSSQAGELEYRLDKINLLACAVEQENRSMVKCLLINGVDVNVKDNQGVSALHIATQRCSITIIKDLLGFKANIEQKNNSGETALYAAALSGSAMFSYLIDKGADYKTINYKGDTILHAMAYAVVEGVNLRHNLEKIVGKCDVNATNSKGQTPLHIVSQGSCFTMGKSLLRQYANINAKDFKGNTPLVEAILHQRVNAVRDLIQEKADIFSLNNEGMQPLHIAIQVNNKQIITYLRNRQAEIASLNQLNSHIATAQQYLPLESSSSAAVLSTGFGFFRPSFRMCSPLHEYAKKGQLNNLIHLLGSYSLVNIDAPDNKGNTALLLAAKHGYLNIVTFLLRHHANIYYTNHDANSALHLAISRSRFNIVECLVEAGADIHQTNSENKTPLAIAIECEHQDIIDYLQRQPPTAKQARY